MRDYSFLERQKLEAITVLNRYTKFAPNLDLYLRAREIINIHIDGDLWVILLQHSCQLCSATLLCEASPSFHRRLLTPAPQCALAFIARRATSFSSKHRDAEVISSTTHVTAPKTVVLTATDSMLAVYLSKTTTPSRNAGIVNG
jgi:hypothetical protein